MSFDQSDLGVTVLLVILGIIVLVTISVIIKTFANDAKEKKAKAARLAAEEQKEKAAQQRAQAPAKPASKSGPSKAPAHKDDVNDDDDLVAAAEVYLTYELVEQAITSLEKHLLTHPTDKKALDLLKKAEESNQGNSK